MSSTPTASSTNPGATRRRTLSKSDFILARTCAAKLFFRENGYPDTRDNDPYLGMLAEGGYMVEALAKARYADGIRLEYGRDAAADFARTLAALEAENATLFEATLLVGRRLARVDILEKRGNVVRLLEVKAKSFDSAEHARLLAEGKAGALCGVKKPHHILEKWDEKLADVTYQMLLLERVLPGVTIQPCLVLVDKSKTAGLDNVPGLFELVRHDGPDGHTRLHTARYTGSAALRSQLDLITEVDVSREVAMLRDDVESAAAAFEARLEREWWPALRVRYGDRQPVAAFDGRVLEAIRTPESEGELARRYPAHLHINLLPAFQSGGWGRKLIEAELDSLRRVGAPAVFLGVGLTNARAIGFYAHVGFERVEGPANALWFARQL